MKKALFVQPRHIYAPKTGLGHVYMPSAALFATARVLTAGGIVTFQDENIQPIHIDETVDVVGMHTIGPSLIPNSLSLQEKISAKKPSMKFIQGGQVISGLDKQSAHTTDSSQPNFRRLFGEKAVNGNFIANVARELDLETNKIPTVTKTSLIPAYEKISDELMRLYLSNQFSLYVSQGCKNICSFCSATRSHKNTLEGLVHRSKEEYRDIDIIRNDVNYLLERGTRLGIEQLSMYVSNLDIMQTPKKIEDFAKMMIEATNNYHGIIMNLSGLACVESYKHIVKNHPKIIDSLKEAGFTNIGFGVEGIAPNYWQSLKKGKNNEEDCYWIVEDTINRGFTPEILLTPGHANETLDTLKSTTDYANKIKELYGDKVVIRPYVAKTWLPGNDGWHSGAYNSQIELVLSNPQLFQSLDFNAEQTELTAINKELVPHINNTFKHLCTLSNNTVEYIRAITPQMSKNEMADVRRDNEGKYDH